MTPPHIQVDIAFPTMVGSIKAGSFSQKRAWVFGQRMKEKRVDNRGRNLSHLLARTLYDVAHLDSTHVEDCKARGRKHELVRHCGEQRGAGGWCVYD